ncbi:class I SAM-dependent methyltransferase [Pedobacter duraquae]|nr:class I SAM-dependent methyltransferase [Pedobacter duraquae]
MRELQRFDMIQACINEIKKRKKKVNYLEIGVETGFCFFMIKSTLKLAVDPNFTIKNFNKIKAYVRNPHNFNNKFFELTSDRFFEEQHEYLKKIGGLDVVFIDGLHLSEQVIKDINNALMNLNDGGFILLHDCNPINETSAIRAHHKFEVYRMNLPDYNGIWNGDVWKALVELRATRKDINVKVFDTDQGIGMVTKEIPENNIQLTQAELEKLSYVDLEKNRVDLLNLKSPAEFSKYIRQN